MVVDELQTRVAAIGMRAHGPTRLERFGAGALEGWSALQTSPVAVLRRGRGDV